jgi:hypothetical protein
MVPRLTLANGEPTVVDNGTLGPFSAIYDEGTGNVEAFGTFDVTFNVSAVPEPSTWVMILLGVAGVGFMAHRRRKSAMLAA